MKMSFRIYSLFGMMALVTALLSVPQAGHAQRMNHPNYNGGGRPSAPSQNFNRPAPAVNRPAPPVNRPVEQPRQIENRPTINGGGNMNHDYNQHNYNRNTAVYRPPV